MGLAISWRMERGQKPSRTKAGYTEEYKQEALELWGASGRSAAKVAISPVTTLIRSFTRCESVLAVR